MNLSNSHIYCIIINIQGMTLYMQAPPSLEIALRKNLDISLGDLIHNGETLIVTDPMLNNVSLSLIIEFM